MWMVAPERPSHKSPHSITRSKVQVFLGKTAGIHTSSSAPTDTQAAAHHPRRGDPRHYPKLAGQPELTQVFAPPLALATDQRQRERGRKVYSLHAPAVECIGKAAPVSAAMVNPDAAPAARFLDKTTRHPCECLI